MLSEMESAPLVLTTDANPFFLFLGFQACDYFCIELRRVPCDPLTQRAVPKAMKRRMDSNTIALVCSAVAFPHGTHDPVAALATIAKQRGVGLHVDCCLGSFLLPFAEEAGFPLSPFDFRAGEGVTSMSIDHHKYAALGISLLTLPFFLGRTIIFTNRVGCTLFLI